MARVWREILLREKGGFAAVGIAEEEDRDYGWAVHEQVPIESLGHFEAPIT